MPPKTRGSKGADSMTSSPESKITKAAPKSQSASPTGGSKARKDSTKSSRTANQLGSLSLGGLTKKLKQQKQQQQQRHIDVATDTAGGSQDVSAPKPEALLFQANTVVEAQESGEQARFRDEAIWALEGLKPGSPNLTIQNSLASLVDIATSHRGRMALRSGGFQNQLIAYLEALNPGDDVIVSLGMSTLFLTFCQLDTDRAILATTTIARISKTLLSCRGFLEDQQLRARPICVRMTRPLRESYWLKEVPPEARGSPLMIMLTALSALLDPFGHVDVEPLKHELRRQGILELVANKAMELAAALVEKKPSYETVLALYQLTQALAVLERSSFACPENEAYLVGITLHRGIPPLITTQGFVPWATQQVHERTRKGLVYIQGEQKKILGKLLAVLMNLSQNNAQGCQALANGGALEILPGLLTDLLLGDGKKQGCFADPKQLDNWVDELTGCLCVLINLAAHRPEARGPLKTYKLVLKSDNAAGQHSSGGGGGGGKYDGLVPLLCSLMNMVLDHVDDATPKKGAAAGRGSSGSKANKAHKTTSPSDTSNKEGGDEMMVDTSEDAVITTTTTTTKKLETRPSNGEVTLDALEEDDMQGTGLIVEVYAAILLGFLIDGDAVAQKEAAGLLPGKNLDTVITALGRCLQFYIRAGAITKTTEDTLRTLLQSLIKTNEGF